jgi:hypothetical protein
MPPPPAFIVHDLAQARIVFAAASVVRVPIRVESAPGAAGYAGAGWWAAMIAAARHEYPEVEAVCVLDCGEEPGRALGAIRQGVEAIRCRARPKARARLKALAEAAGVTFVSGRTADILDLATVPEPNAAVAARLGPRTVRKAPRKKALREKARKVKESPTKSRGKPRRGTLQKG